MFSDFSLNVNLDQTNVKNLQTLWNRKSGELLYSDNGQLKVMGLFQKIHYKLSQSYREQINTTLSKTVSKLTIEMKKDSIEGNRAEDFISELFFKKLSRLSRQVYKREISENMAALLARRIKLAEGEIPSEASKLYVEAYHGAKLWARLGNFEALSGSSGSYRIIKGKVTKNDGVEEKESTLGIFKPADEDTLAEGNRKTIQKIKRWLLNSLASPFKGSLFDTVAGQAYVAEAATKLVESHVLEAVEEYLKKDGIDTKLQALLKNLILITDTHIGKMGFSEQPEKVGSFQLWVQEPHKEASQALGLKKNYQPYFLGSTPSLDELKAKVPPELFDLLVIIDYLTANSDRHGENWFITEDKNGNGTGIRLIDGGWSMSPKHPTWWDKPELEKQYLWQNLALSEEKFTDFGQHVIHYLSANKKRLKNAVKALYDQHLVNDLNKNEERINRMMERLEVIAQLGKSATKKELAQIQLEKEIKRLLLELSLQPTVVK